MRCDVIDSMVSTHCHMHCSCWTDNMLQTAPFGSFCSINQCLSNVAHCRVWLHLPQGRQAMEPKSEVVRWCGRPYQTPLEHEAPAQPLPGSALGFSVNGVWQVRSVLHMP